jgi:hypothetical protein
MRAHDVLDDCEYVEQSTLSVLRLKFQILSNAAKGGIPIRYHSYCIWRRAHARANLRNPCKVMLPVERMRPDLAMQRVLDS